MVFIEAGNADDAELKKKKEKGKKSPVNDMISLTYIKVRTYLIDLKFRIKQMEVL